ncbi:hypothetical protein LINGRAHAP2_LOCUS31877 [Linum grandiflorum]
MLIRGSISVVLLIMCLYQITYPPPPNICGSPNGPPITGPRIKLRDGRHLAYKEHGVPKDAASFKVIFIHGFFSCRHDPVITFHQEVYQELGVHIVSFDRPGYGESDPDPKRSPKSLAMDVEELADKLGIGYKFYVVGFSMGGQAVWGCLNYIPHRLAGATLIAPAVNYWWPGFPANLSKQAYKLQQSGDQWALRVAHYAPWLTYWWNSQNWFPTSAVAAGDPQIFSTQDLQIRSNTEQLPNEVNAYIIQQGKYESLHRDMMVGFGSWEFDPMDIKNPFPEKEGSVQLWQGDDDRMVPVILQRYIAEKLPWITYHELAGVGHLFPFIPEQTLAILKALLSPLSSSSKD